MSGVQSRFGLGHYPGLPPAFPLSPSSPHLVQQLDLVPCSHEARVVIHLQECRECEGGMSGRVPCCVPPPPIYTYRAIAGKYTYCYPPQDNVYCPYLSACVPRDGRQ